MTENQECEHFKKELKEHLIILNKTMFDREELDSLAYSIMQGVFHCKFCGAKQEGIRIGREEAEDEIFGKSKIPEAAGFKRLLNKFVLMQIMEKCRKEGLEKAIEIISEHSTKHEKAGDTIYKDAEVRVILCCDEIKEELRAAL